MGPLSKKNSILILSTYPPRECGIATFTQDLLVAFNKKFNPVIKAEICALNDRIYNYNSNVAYQIDSAELEGYVSLAREINSKDEIKIVNIQHEFGLFGGEYGDYIIPFLQALEKPVVTTFHSIIPKPDKKLRKIVSAIIEKSNAVILMNSLSEETLVKDYKICSNKITYIPHGIPQVSFEDSKKFKKALGLEKKTVLSTFGLISRNKGIEYAIRALSKVVKKYPDTVYLIIGETHPKIMKLEGEKYRNSLIREIKKLGLENNVKFFNNFLSIEELIRLLKATDIYLSPSSDKKQCVSGTLSYALGCGRPVVSTATEYANHIVTKNNGMLVRIKDSQEIADAVMLLISNEKKRKLMAARAYKDTRAMIWPNVADRYFKTYNKFVDFKTENKLPEIKFDHIIRMTDEFGILQHARYNRPDKRFGYSLDDIARALIACAMLYKDNPSEQLRKLMDIYIKFIKFAKKKDGSFANIISYRRKKDKIFEQDAQGRAFWALGYVVSREYLPQDLKKEACRLFQSSEKIFYKIHALRSVAFAMLGIYFFLQAFPKDSKMKKAFLFFSKQLTNSFKNNACPGWQWFEDFLTYSNSKLAEALFCAYDLTGDKKCLKIAKSALSFLESATLGSEYYMPIGQKGWYFKNRKRAYFDQQPEDTASMVQTEILAFKITGDRKYLKNALKVFYWFLGKNFLNMMVYDESTGGCNDGLGEKELNLNQGAESTISYAMARLSFNDKGIKI